MRSGAEGESVEQCVHLDETVSSDFLFFEQIQNVVELFFACGLSGAFASRFAFGVSICRRAASQCTDEFRRFVAGQRIDFPIASLQRVEPVGVESIRFSNQSRQIASLLGVMGRKPTDPDLGLPAPSSDFSSSA